MGINVRVQKCQKPLGIIEVQANLERDLKSCMRCRFFYGNNRQCIAKKGVKGGIAEAVQQEKEHEKEIVFEQEESKMDRHIEIIGIDHG